MTKARTAESIQKSKENKAKNRSLGLHKKCGRKFMTDQEKAKMVKIHAKSCTLMSPQGEVVLITNFADFGRKMGWGAGSVCKLASGKRNSLFGWKLASPKLNSDLVGSGD
jgi:hypothetical protein